MNNIFDEIRTKEFSLLDQSIRKHADKLDELLADDFTEFGSSGNVYNKLDVMENLQKNENEVVYTATNFGLKILSDNVILSTFKTERVTNGTERVTSLRSSIWRKDNNVWKMCFHQGTVIYD